MENGTIPADCVVFDTETTGFDFSEGDRLVEIGAVGMSGGLPNRESFHRYINPQRTVPAGAVEVHGLTTEFLRDKPLFEEVVQEFLDFVGDRPLVAHNAKFDSKFINGHLAELGLPVFAEDRFVDTVPIAKRKYPGQQVSLDALCRKMKISLSGRDKHGALVNSELLAEVCVELMGGRQSNFLTEISKAEAGTEIETGLQQIETFVRHASEEEKARHAALVADLGENAIWKKYLGDAA